MENPDIAKEENLAGISDGMIDLLYAVEQSPQVSKTQIGQEQEEMDAHDESNSNKDIPFHYSSKICFLSNDDFDMVAAKKEEEVAIGWRLIPGYLPPRIFLLSQA